MLIYMLITNIVIPMIGIGVLSILFLKDNKTYISNDEKLNSPRKFPRTKKGK